MQASSVVLTVHGQLKQWILRIFLSNIRHVKHIYAYGFYCSKFSGDLLRQKPQKRLRHSFASCVLSSAALYMHWINELLIKVVYTTEMERETASIFSLLSCLSDCSCFRLQEVQPVSGLFWSFQCTGDVPDWLFRRGHQMDRGFPQSFTPGVFCCLSYTPQKALSLYSWPAPSPQVSNLVKQPHSFY